MTIADKIIHFCHSLATPDNLPDDVVVMNPYKDEKASLVARTFYQKFYNDENPRYMLLGINPGRYGAGVTGVPFTDPIRLQKSCGIPNSFDQKPELSSRFIYDVVHAYGGPSAFYGTFYFSAISPLGFVKNDRNLNYYDIPDWKKLFESYAVGCIREQLKFPVRSDVVYCIGQGQNLKFLTYLNEKYGFFGAIKTVPHPRWVMQYRLKRKDEFIMQYLEALQST